MVVMSGGGSAISMVRALVACALAVVLALTAVGLGETLGVSWIL